MKEPIQIVRIEHPRDGMGLWNSRENNQEKINEHSQYKNISDRHMNYHIFPNYSQDDELKKQIGWNDILDYNFAFKSLDQLATALTNEELKECINELGFKVLMLTVTDYFQSSYQVVYRKSSITEQNDISFMFL